MLERTGTLRGLLLRGTSEGKVLNQTLQYAEPVCDLWDLNTFKHSNKL